MAPLAGRFTTFGVQHLVVLGIFVAGAGALTWLGSVLRDSPRQRWVCRAFALLIPCFTVPRQTLALLPSHWHLGSSLPLQICDLAWIVSMYALWTRRQWAVSLNYYWGFTLTTQALITPDIGSVYPHYQYLMFWVVHVLIVWSAFLLTGLRIGPRWRDFKIAVFITSAWLVLVLCFDRVTNTDYGYINGKPGRDTALNLLGPWPLYVVFEVVLVAVVWALMTWPWVVARRRASGPPG